MFFDFIGCLLGGNLRVCQTNLYNRHLQRARFELVILICFNKEVALIKYCLESEMNTLYSTLAKPNSSFFLYIVCYKHYPQNIGKNTLMMSL